MRYFIGLMITIGLLFVLIFMLVRSNNAPTVPSTTKTLVSYATSDANVSMLIDGPINAASEHRQIYIEVDKNKVTYQELQGYDGRVKKMSRFANTVDSYTAFLSALQRAGYTKGDTSEALADEKGYCALSNRFVFKLTEGVETIQRFWGTSCGGKKSYQGNINLTIDLFKAQVPDYETLSQNVGI